MSAPDIDTTAIPRAIAQGVRPTPPNAATASLTLGWRSMRKLVHVPEQLVDVTIGPILLLVTFTYLFGGAIAGSTADYLQFLLPGILVQAVLFTAVNAGVSIHTDARRGVADRFRTLPIWRPAPLVGPVLGDVVRYVIAAVVVIGVGSLLGFDTPAGVVGAAAAIGLVALFAFATSWVFTTLGLVLRTPNAVQGTCMLISFLTVFVSNVFVDPDTLPSLPQAIVDANPISHLTTATRALLAGTATGSELLVVIVEAAILVAIFAPLTSHLYRKQ